jgi:hypothetical protein
LAATFIVHEALRTTPQLRRWVLRTELGPLRSLWTRRLPSRLASGHSRHSLVVAPGKAPNCMQLKAHPSHSLPLGTKSGENGVHACTKSRAEAASVPDDPSRAVRVPKTGRNSNRSTRPAPRLDLSQVVLSDPAARQSGSCPILDHQANRSRSNSPYRPGYP